MTKVASSAHSSIHDCLSLREPLIFVIHQKCFMHTFYLVTEQTLSIMGQTVNTLRFGSSFLVVHCVLWNQLAKIFCNN